MFTIGDIDAAAAARKLSVSDRLHLKRSLEVAGLLDTAGTVVTKPVAAKPDPAMVRSIFANELHLDPQKLSVAQLNAKLEARGTLPKRKMQIKETLWATTPRPGLLPGGPVIRLSGTEHRRF